MTFIQAAGRTPLNDIDPERLSCGVCVKDLTEGPGADALPLLRRVEVEMLDPHAVLVRSHRDQADIDSCDLYDSGARRLERVVRRTQEDVAIKIRRSRRRRARP